MLATISLLLAVVPLSLCKPPRPPICETPPPPAPLVPNSTDCHDLVADIYKIAQLEDDEPVIWTTSPQPPPPGYRQVPFFFKFGRYESNDCEFRVVPLTEGSQDTFPTSLVAQAADAVVQKCMDEGVSGGEETVGAVAVGPKRTFAVVLGKVDWRRSSRSGALNTTNVKLLGPGNVSGLSASVIEDG